MLRYGAVALFRRTKNIQNTACCSASQFYSHKSLLCHQEIKKFSTADDKDKWVIRSKYPEIEIPDRTITEYFFDIQEQYGSKVALISGNTGQQVTHAELRDRAIRFGSALCRLGISKGDIVGVILPNCIQFSVSFLGVSAAGAVPTTINSNFTSYEIARQLENSGASMLICEYGDLKTIKEASKNLKNFRHIIVVGREVEGTISYEKMLKDDGKGIPANMETNNSEDIALLPYSSGTTGLPKGVMLTHRNVVANSRQAMHPDVTYLRKATANTQDTLIVVLPMYHIYGLTVALFASLATGSRCIIMRSFEQEMYADLSAKYQVTIAYTVPPLMSFLCNSDLITKETLKHTHCVFCAAAPVGPTLQKQFQDKFGKEIALVEGFGMTELSPVAFASPKGNTVLGSCGVVMPSTMAKIVDIDTGYSIAPNKGQGEIYVKGPQVMKGYLNNAKATEETITPDGWLKTGDIGCYDEHDNIYIVDRLKELIKVKGLQVPPAELEDLLRSHPAVDDVAVIGIPDERSGEVPKAFIVPIAGGTLTKEEIMDFVNERVVDYKRLAGGVSFVDAIPKSASGKILRKDLKLL